MATLLAVFIALPALIGYLIPQRFALWVAVATIAGVAISWILHDGSFRDELPFIVTPLGFGLVLGIVLRFVIATLTKGSRKV